MFFLKPLYCIISGVIKHGWQCGQLFFDFFCVGQFTRKGWCPFASHVWLPEGISCGTDSPGMLQPEMARLFKSLNVLAAYLAWNILVSRRFQDIFEREEACHEFHIVASSWANLSNEPFWLNFPKTDSHQQTDAEKKNKPCLNMVYPKNPMVFQ